LRYCKYGVKGTRGIISFETYKSLNDKLSKIERSISYYPGIDEEPNEKDFLLKFINHKEQLIEIRKLASIIKGLSNSTQERARIAITMIQMIPYDNKAAKDDFHIERYPYEVLFDQTGICGEKSKFMAMLLKELQFGTAYIIFPEENHAITGIKCAKEYSFKESGYCFVESTKLTEIGQSDGSYVDVGRLKSIPQIIKISEGQTYEDIKVKYDQYLKGLEEGTHVLITDRFNNKLIRIVSPDYTDIINNPDVIISYGDNTVEYLN